MKWDLDFERRREKTYVKGHVVFFKGAIPAPFSVPDQNLARINFSPKTGTFSVEYKL
jgi:hypothetical protein